MKNQHPARLFLLVIIGLMVFMLLSMGPSNNSATMKAEATRQAIIEETEKTHHRFLRSDTMMNLKHM